MSDRKTFIEGNNSLAFGKKADGWDFNFSPPKTVLENLYLGGDERIREIHNRAVKQAVAFMEENFV
jgi:hypothetical protein